MRFARYSRNALLALAVALSVSFAATAQDHVAAEGSFDRTLKVTGSVDLTVSTSSGTIAVHSGDASTVHVTARIRVSEDWHVSDADAKAKVAKLEANPPIEQNGNTIRIGEIHDDDLRRNVSISYDISTPADTRLVSSTGSGSQTIDGMQSSVEANTGSGNMRISHIGGELRATTGSGSIEVEDVKSNVRATTGSGRIQADGVGGGFTGKTGSGRIESTLAGAGDVDVETGSGGIEIHGVNGRLRAHAGSGTITAEGKPAGDWNVHTGSGEVILRIPPDAPFDLDASTGSGSISLTPSHEILMSGVVGRRHEVHGKVRGGGPVITAHTASGSIRVE
jgi:hypothetical protein